MDTFEKWGGGGMPPGSAATATQWLTGIYIIFSLMSYSSQEIRGLIGLCVDCK